MTDVKQITGYAIARTDSKFNFTMDDWTGKLEIPEGVPKGTVINYVERILFADGTYEDRPKEFTV